MSQGAIVIIGGTSGIGRAIAESYAARNRTVVVACRDAGRAQAIAGEIGGETKGIAVDLAHPAGIAAQLGGVQDVEHLVLSAIDRDDNRAREYNLEGAQRLVTMKLVGYTEAIHVLLPAMREHASILLFGGLAKLAPIRVNALHPGIVGDSPAWEGKPPAVLEAVRARTPLGRLVTMSEVAGAAAFLLENGAVNGVNLAVDGGWLLM